MRLYVVRRNEQAVLEILQLIHSKTPHTLAGFTTDCLSAQAQLSTCCADVVICDAILPGLDGFSLAKRFSQLLFVLISPQVGAVEPPHNAKIIPNKAALVGALDALGQWPLSPHERQVLQSTLLSLGFSPQKRGSQAITFALELILRDESRLRNLRDEVYHPFAERMGTSVASVERNIRYSIECAWNRAELSTLDAVFGYTIQAERGKPTNRAFLAQLAEHIRLHKA